MSARIDTTLICDIKDCRKEFTMPNTKAYNLRHYAKEKGWLTRDSKDLCPECARSEEKRKSISRK